jgi:hypothetical protein
MVDSERKQRVPCTSGGNKTFSLPFPRLESWNWLALVASHFGSREGLFTLLFVQT